MALIEIDDFPSSKPPFMVGIFHGELLNNQMVTMIATMDRGIYFFFKTISQGDSSYYSLMNMRWENDHSILYLLGNSYPLTNYFDVHQRGFWPIAIYWPTRSKWTDIQPFTSHLPSGKRLHNYGKSPFSMGKSTINGSFSIAMLNYQRVYIFIPWLCESSRG